jgi:hypothetical protein
MNTLALICLVCAVVPAALLLANIARYRRAPAGVPRPVSILIPARNEEKNIQPCLESILDGASSELEVIVLNDHSTDRTAEIVRSFDDPRVRLIESAPLPDGWCGKQFACHQLAQAATHPHLIFLDADVRLERGATPRIVAALERSGADLISGVPRQITSTALEKLLIPLIHFILLGFLPFGLMRRLRHPAFAAGCGQLIAVRAESYRRAGGHQSIRASGHDGIELPRAFRRAGLKTDLFDATDVARCRMYSSNAEVWTGLAKNAREGMAKPVLLPIFTFLLFFGQVLPPLLLLLGFATGADAQTLFSLGVGTIAGHAARAVCTHRFAQSWLGTFFHSFSILVFLSIQWWAANQERRGRSILWKGRPQPRLAALALALTLSGATFAADAIRGEDQFGSSRAIQFPAAKPIVLTIADKDGADEVDLWVAALKPKVADRAAFEGIADVTKVPGPLRGMIRKRFAKRYSHGMILDWTGESLARFKPTPARANIYLLSRDGEELARYSGKPTREGIEALLARVNDAAK